MSTFSFYLPTTLVISSLFFSLTKQNDSLSNASHILCLRIRHTLSQSLIQLPSVSLPYKLPFYILTTLFNSLSLSRSLWHILNCDATLSHFSSCGLSYTYALQSLVTTLSSCWLKYCCLQYDASVGVFYDFRAFITASLEQIFDRFLVHLVHLIIICLCSRRQSVILVGGRSFLALWKLENRSNYDVTLLSDVKGCLCRHRVLFNKHVYSCDINVHNLMQNSLMLKRQLVYMSLMKTRVC